MRNRKKNSINWLLNQEQLHGVVKYLGPREITYIEAIILHGSVKEEVVGSYSDMIMYNDEEALSKIQDWVKKLVDNKFISKYIYFRIVRK